jgi:hypothetical protein
VTQGALKKKWGDPCNDIHTEHTANLSNQAETRKPSSAPQQFSYANFRLKKDALP